MTIIKKNKIVKQYHFKEKREHYNFKSYKSSIIRTKISHQRVRLILIMLSSN